MNSLSVRVVRSQFPYSIPGRKKFQLKDDGKGKKVLMRMKALIDCKPKNKI
jgi:hypothetical protein